MATKTKRADTFFCRIHAHAKYPCAASSTPSTVALLKGYLELFVPPYTPKFE
jgi:hypothetical protein